MAGHSLGTGAFYDYTAIKYNREGVELWVARYDGVGHKNDKASDLAIDRSGNVYVTGYGIGADHSQHYMTVKFNRNGIQQWADLYKWLENNNDQAGAVAVDDSGNIYVTGHTGATAKYPDYVTIKYSPDGVKQWVARYNNTDTFSYDFAKAIAVDRWGSVYVTGRSIGAGTSYDYATAKYNRDGVKQWVARYNGAGNRDDGANDIAIDDAGNVYVTGFSATSSTASYDIATIKYNSAGVQQWVARYQKELYSSDESRCIAVDSSGNVYVGGYSNGPSGNGSLVTLKYNSAGAQQWVGLYNGPGINAATALAVDGSGNVHVTGNSDGVGTGRDYVTIKYNNAGNQQWIARYNGPGNKDDFASAIAVDDLQNIYVTGSSVGAGTMNDYVTIKYSPAGKQQWVARYNGPAKRNDGAAALAIDRRGDIIVTGYSTGIDTKADFTTIKYLSDNVTAGCFGETLPSSGAFGKIKGGNQTHVDQMNYCFSGQAGDLLLSFRAYDIDGPNEVHVLLNGVKVGAVPATANEQWSGELFVLMPDSLIKDNAANSLVFDNKLNPPQFSFWGVRQVSVQSCFRLPSLPAYGNIHTGDQNHAGRVAYSFPGQVGDLHLNYEVFDIDNIDEVDVSMNGIKIYDEAVTANGKWSGARTFLLPDSLVNDVSLNLLIFDNTMNPPNALKWGIRNVSVISTLFRAAETELAQLPINFYLAQNFPNPFNPITTIHFALPEPINVKLTLYDVQGQLVKTLLEEKLNAGYHHITLDASRLASGILFYRLEAGAFVATRKMILAK